MAEVVLSWGDEVGWPAAVGATAVLAALVLRRHGWASAGAVVVSGTWFVVWTRTRLHTAWESLGDLPLWFTATVAVAAAAVTVAMARLLRRGRGPEGLVVGAVAVGAAAAALPDVAVLLGLAALWMPWGVLAVDPARAAMDRVEPEPGRPGAGWAALAAIASGLLVSFALVDGARGRAGSVLIAPVVVGSVALTAIAPPARRSWWLLVWLFAVGSVGLLVARHAGLTAGTARPLTGALLGLGALGAGYVLVQRRTAVGR